MGSDPTANYDVYRSLKGGGSAPGSVDDLVFCENIVTFFVQDIVKSAPMSTE